MTLAISNNQIYLEEKASTDTKDIQKHCAQAFMAISKEKMESILENGSMLG